MEVTQQSFLLEKQLHMLDPQLHRGFSDAILVLLKQLQDYQSYFPEYTDHTELHALMVIDYCNQLVGAQNAEKLNADELYVLLMSCYLHDIGMGIRKADYEEFCNQLGLGRDYVIHDPERVPQIIRDHHHEFSACYIRKYAELLDLPSEEHTFAIAQISKGHRRTNLFDPYSYPEKMSVPGGNTLCLPYLTAILSMADELDVTAQRNLESMYDISRIKDEHQIFEFKKHMAVTDLDVTHDACILHVDTEEEEVLKGITAMVDKMQKRLEYCVSVVSDRTPYEITQHQILIKR